MYYFHIVVIVWSTTHFRCPIFTLKVEGQSMVVHVNRPREKFILPPWHWILNSGAMTIKFFARFHKLKELVRDSIEKYYVMNHFSKRRVSVHYDQYSYFHLVVWSTRCWHSLHNIHVSTFGVNEFIT